MEEVRKDILEWGEGKGGGEQVVFYVPVSERKGQKAGHKLNILLCIGKHPTESVRLFVLKRDGPGHITASKKRKCQIRDVVRLEMPEGNNPDHEVSVVLGDWSKSQKHIWKWFCSSHSELEHLVVSVANYFQSDVGKPLPVTGGRVKEYDFVGEEQKKIVREDTQDKVEADDEQDELGEGKEENEGNNVITEAEEKDLMAMLKADMRMDEIAKHRQMLVQELALLQDAHIHATLSSTELIKHVCSELGTVATQASSLEQDVSRCDEAIKGAENDLLALKSSSRRFHTLSQNQAKLAAAAASITADLSPLESHVRIIREAPLTLDANGRVSPDLLAALKALSALINDSLRKVPDQLLHIDAVDESRTVLHDLRFSFVRRSVLHLQVEQQRALKAVKQVQVSTSPTFADMAGLSPIHRHLKGYFALTQRIAALDPKAREDLLDSYCRAVEPIAKNNVKDVMEWMKANTARRKRKDEGLASTHQLAVQQSDRWGDGGSSWHSREDDIEGGSKGSPSKMWFFLLSVVERTAKAEGQFLDGWLGSGNEGGEGGEGGGAGPLVEAGVSRVLQSVSGEVLTYCTWLCKRDAMVVPELMAEVDTMLEKVMAGGEGARQGGAGLWVATMVEAQRSLRLRLNRFIDEQVEVVMDAKVSTKKAPAWTARIGAVVRELERAAVMNVDEGPGCEQTMAQVDKAVERLLIGALQALGKVSATDPKHGRSYMVMSLRAMINSLIGGRTLDDGGPRAAVLEVVTEAKSMQKQQMEQYVAVVAARELSRMIRASDTVARQEREWSSGGGGGAGQSEVVPISMSKTALQDAVRAELGGNLEKTLGKLMQRVVKDFHEDAGAVLIAWEELSKFVQHKYEVLQQAALKWYRDELQPSASALKQVLGVVGRAAT